MKNFRLLLVALVALLASCAEQAPKTQAAAVRLNPDGTEMTIPVRDYYRDGWENQEQAIQALIEGNKRFVDGTLVNYPQGMDYLKQFDGKEQIPHAIIISCSDMRIPVELIFDQGVGDLEVIQTAANSFMDDMDMGAVELAFNRHMSGIIIVLSHTNCDAIHELLVSNPKPQESDLAIENMVAALDKVIPGYKGTHGDLNTAIQANKKAQHTNLCTNSDALKMAWAEGRVHMISATYDEATGVVTLDL